MSCIRSGTMLALAVLALTACISSSSVSSAASSVSTPVAEKEDVLPATEEIDSSPLMLISWEDGLRQQGIFDEADPEPFRSRNSMVGTITIGESCVIFESESPNSAGETFTIAWPDKTKWDGSSGTIFFPSSSLAPERGANIESEDRKWLGGDVAAERIWPVIVEPDPSCPNDYLFVDQVCPAIGDFQGPAEANGCNVGPDATPVPIPPDQ